MKRFTGNRVHCIGSDRGVALIMVFWVLTLLSVIALEFCFGMRTEVNLTRNYKDSARLYYYAQGGIQRGIAELVWISDPFLHQKRTAPRIEETVEFEKEWRCDGTPYTVNFQDGEAEVRIRSESGRISLNRAPDQLLRRVIGYFVEAGEQRDVIVDSILDWRDPDDFHRLNGAENDYYRSLPEPYDCKNGEFDTVEELLLVRGVTAELFYGKRRGEDDREAMPVIGLRDVFTVFSTSAQVDVNLASPEVLAVVFGIPFDLAKKIVDARLDAPFRNPDQLQQRVPEVAPYLQAARPFVTYASSTPYYHISSVAKLKEEDVKRAIECVVKIDRREKVGYLIVSWNDAGS